MKAVIAVPSVHDFYFTPSRASALGAAALEKILSSCGIKADILNFPAQSKKSVKLQLPGDLSHLEPHILKKEHGPLSFFTNFKRFGPERSACAAQIIELNPDIVFISCFAWAYAAESIDLAEELKRLSSCLPIAVGGAGVTVNPDYFRKSKTMDFVLPGEAESIIPVFLDEVYSISSSITQSENTKSELRFLWNETGVSAKKKQRFISAMLTRGCPKKCRFCANHLVHGRTFRKSELKEIENEIAKIPSDLNVHINFEDDNLLFDRKYFLDVLKIINNKFPDAVFTAENGLDYTLLDTETINLLIGSGFKAFNFSMTSSSRELLSKENRPADSSKLKNAIETAAAAGIPSTTYFICGLEGDSPASVLDSLIALHSLPTLTGISMFYPVPGLENFPPEKMSRISPRLCAGSSAWPWNGSLSTIQLITAFRLSRLSNLIKTEQGLIPGDGRSAGKSTINSKLLTRIRESGRLHSLCGKTIVELPHQDEGLVSGFLSTASID